MDCPSKELLETTTKPVAVITHMNPDSDGFSCAWLIRNFVPKDTDVKIDFVPAGKRLPANDPYWKDHIVVHVDTGGGEYDQHGKELEYSSSFELLANALGCRGDAAVENLIVMVNAADNVRDMDQTSIHYFFSALPHSCKVSDKKWEKEIDWSMVLDQVLFVLDTMAGKWRFDAKKLVKFDKALENGSVEIETLPNGLKFCSLVGLPTLRHGAYMRGVDVVAWTAPRKGGFYPEVQVSNRSKVNLKPLIGVFREEEARLRNVSTDGFDLYQFTQVEGIPGWFLHDSYNFVASGTNSHPLAGDDLTKIEAGVFIELTRRVLSEMEFEKRDAA